MPGGDGLDEYPLPAEVETHRNARGETAALHLGGDNRRTEMRGQERTQADGGLVPGQAYGGTSRRERVMGGV